jgi:hypothetical protein
LKALTTVTGPTGTVPCGGFPNTCEPKNAKPVPVEAECPNAGESVVGGGVSLEPGIGVTIQESIPIEKAAKGNPGWKAEAVMAAGESGIPKNTEGKVNAFVICAS